MCRDADLNDSDVDREYDSENLKCRSAPISPRIRSNRGSNNSYNQELKPSRSTRNNAREEKTNNFVYDMNLYSDKNFVLLNSKDEFSRNQTKLNKSLRSASSSAASLNNTTECSTLEPLVIQEEVEASTLNVIKKTLFGNLILKNI